MFVGFPLKVFTKTPPRNVWEVTWLCIFNGRAPGVTAAQETAKVFFQFLRDAIDTIESLGSVTTELSQKMGMIEKSNTNC